MKTTTRVLAALPAVALLLPGCGSTDGATAARPAAADPTSTTTTAPPTTAPPTTQPAGTPTTIPAGVRLPHEGHWDVMGNGDDLTPMPQLCIDPPPRLSDQQPTDGRAFYEAGTLASPSEALGVYAGPAAAAEAVDDWREQVATCGAAGPQSHTGEPVEWFVTRTRLDGADEAWQAYELSQDVDGEDVSGKDPFVTVARVGSAVYVETFFHPGHLDDDSVAESSRSGAASVGSYLPTLAPFAP